jgi:putative modified peptide
LVRSLLGQGRGKCMSQRDVERTLGRLLTDAAFRRDFFRNPARACLELGVQLAAHEVDALLRVSPRRLASLAEQLDHRICRLDIEDVIDPSPPIGEH